MSFSGSVSEPAYFSVRRVQQGTSVRGKKSRAVEIQDSVDFGAGVGRISWAQPFLRPAADARQAAAFSRLLNQSGCVPSNGSPTASQPGTSSPADSRPTSSTSDSTKAPAHMGSSHSDSERNSGVCGDLRGSAGEALQGASVRAVGVDEAAAAVPGLPEEALRAAVGQDRASTAALWIEGSHVVHPERYLRWIAPSDGLVMAAALNSDKFIGFQGYLSLHWRPMDPSIVLRVRF